MTTSGVEEPGTGSGGGTGTGTDESGADALLAGLRAAGVDVVFANLGSDHAGIIESLAAARRDGEETPAVVLAPHEASAMHAAHGYAAVTGRPQAVFVHVDVGTANLGGAVHNAARARIPALIFAGLTPYTLEGELPGTRNSYPNHLQDVHDQHALVRPYTKWSYDLRTGTNARQVVLRALQLAASSPKGPVYLTAAREVLAMRGAGRHPDPALWAPIDPVPAPDDAIREMVAAIAEARFPVLVTSGLGREPESVRHLVELAETMGMGVVNALPSALAFPADHDLHIGYLADPVLAEADLLLVVDSGAPWMPAIAAPRPDAAVYVIDSDPLQESIPLWYLEARRFVRADPEVAVAQLTAAAHVTPDRGDVEGRRARLGAVHAKQRAAWAAERNDARLTAATVATALHALVDDDTVLLNESISNASTVFRHFPRTRPGTLLASGGSSLGWHGGAAVGIKLARPDVTVVAIVGDGSYHLSEPTSTYWMAAQYGTPFLTVILDNGGWNATKQNVLRQHAGGAAKETARYFVNLGQTTDLAGVALAAGGAHAATVDDPSKLEAALSDGLAAVRDGRCAVIRVILEAVSDEPADIPPAGSA
ncbi:MAG TPA: thiamine pyrophosphate-requiring protein [Naasia sp.]|jgi:acetolactate synthase-1/2/3 large subunit